MNISIDRRGTKVRLTCDTESELEEVLYLYWECDSGMFAELLAKHMQEQLDGHITAIRKAAYEAGWKDAKAKKEKRTWFDWAFRVIDWT